MLIVKVSLLLFSIVEYDCHSYYSCYCDSSHDVYGFANIIVLTIFVVVALLLWLL